MPKVPMPAYTHFQYTLYLSLDLYSYIFHCRDPGFIQFLRNIFSHSRQPKSGYIHLATAGNESQKFFPREDVIFINIGHSLLFMSCTKEKSIYMLEATGIVTKQV